MTKKDEENNNSKEKDYNTTKTSQLERHVWSVGSQTVTYLFLQF